MRFWRGPSAAGCRFLNGKFRSAILVSMTRKRPVDTPPKPRRKVSGAALDRRWPLQDAKARFSELVRRARSEGPQRVTVHGRDEVVVISAEDFSRLKGDRTGAALVAALQSSPHKEVELEARRAPMPVREVDL